MSDNVIQTSFAAGELSPSLIARVDLQKYKSGAAILRNFFVDYRSGATTRTGTQLVWQSMSVNRPRLIGFQLSTAQAFVCEFGDNPAGTGYIRFIQNGGYVLEASNAITGISTANPAVITVANVYAAGDIVFISGVGGPTALNGQYYKVTNASGANITIARTNGLAANTLAMPAYTAGGTVARVYTIASPYAAADLPTLKFAQLGNTITITHPNYPPKLLVAVSTVPPNWTLTTITFGSTIVAPTGTAAAITGMGGTANYAYVVTTVDNNGQESVQSAAATITNGIDISSTAGTVTVTWNPVVGAAAYNVYKAELSFAGAVPSGAAFGFVGSAFATTFIDSNIQPDFSTSPPFNQNPFAANNNPGVNCFYQQRQVFAASTADPQTFWMSIPGTFNNFNVSDPVQADDAITGSLVSTQVNAIKWLLPMPGGLVAGTSKGAWQISGGSGSVQGQVPITPANAQAVPQAYNGASDVPPIVVNYDIIYVQAKGSIVRDLAYNIYVNIYTGTDISVLSNHLFFGHQIQEWAYAEEPYKNIWCVREDGIALTLTLLKEQEIFGWSRHDTNGLFVSVASITEGQVDAVYFVVQRTLAGGTFYFVERLANTPAYTYGAEDAIQSDCSISSTLPQPAATIAVAAASGNGVQVLASAGVFTAGSIGQVLRAGGGIMTVATYVSPQQVTVNITKPITQVIPNNGLPIPFTSGNWSLATPTTTFTGLDPFEGMTLSVLADGGVQGPLLVTNGTITLQTAATKVCAGLGFQAQLQTMYLDVGEPTIQGKRKKIAALTVRNANSRGLKGGRTFNTLVPIKELSPSVPLGQPMPLITGDTRFIMDPLWDVPGQICLQQDDPLPATVLGVIPEIIVGDTAK